MVGPQGARTSLSVHMSCAACSYCDTDSTAQVSSVYHRHSLSIETLELSVRILTHVHVLKRFGGVANELSPARVRSRRRIRKRAASRLPRMHDLAAVEQVRIVRPCMRKCSNYRRAKFMSITAQCASCACTPPHAISQASSRLAVHPQPVVQACLPARAQLQRLRPTSEGPALGPCCIIASTSDCVR